MFRLVPDEPMVMVQSADPEAYFDMLRITARPNRAFCLRHGIRYACLHAVLRGFHPWQACFNRVFLLNDLVDLGYRGWYLHLDADAYVHDRGFDLAGYLAGHAGRAFVFSPGGDKGRWDVNDGVFFANLAHPAARETARLWKAGVEALDLGRMRLASNWYGIPDGAEPAAARHGVPGDQALLHKVLRDNPPLEAALHIEDRALLNGPAGRFTRQVLRSSERAPARRLRRIATEVARSLAEGDDPGDGPDVLLPALAHLLGVPAPDQDMLAGAADPDGLAPVLHTLLAAREGARRGLPPRIGAAGLETAGTTLPALARALGVPQPADPALLEAATDRDALVQLLKDLIAVRKEIRREEREAARAARRAAEAAAPN